MAESKNTLEKDLLNLAHMYLHNVLKDIVENQKIEFSYSDNKITAKFDNKEVTIDLNCKKVTMVTTVCQTLIEEKCEEDFSFLPPPVEIDPHDVEDEIFDIAEDNQSESVSDIETIYKQAKSEIEKHIEKAKSTGDTMYINHNGTCCYPMNFESSCKGRVFPSDISLDDYDEMIEKILEDFPCVEVLEDLDSTMVFHFGGAENDL